MSVTCSILNGMHAFVTCHYDDNGKLIVDNDWFGLASFIPVLLLLAAEMEVLGLTVVVDNSGVDHTTLHILRFLELSRLSSKISVYKGPDLSSLEYSISYGDMAKNAWRNSLYRSICRTESHCRSQWSRYECRSFPH